MTRPTCSGCVFSDALEHPTFVLTADCRVRGVSLTCARFGWLCAHNATCDEWTSRAALDAVADGVSLVSGDFSGGVLHRDPSPITANPRETPRESPRTLTNRPGTT